MLGFTKKRSTQPTALPEAGHLAWSDQPEMFASMITDWVRTEHKKTS